MEKYDLSNQAYDQASPNPIPLLDRCLISASAIATELAYEHGSPQERSDLRAAGAILIGSSALTAVTTTVGLHLAMGSGGVHWSFVAVGIGIGALTGAIDRAVQYKGTRRARGLEELKLSGLKLPDSKNTTRIPYFVRVVRFGQAATFGFLGGTFLILATNSTDIQSYIDSKFVNSNRAVAEESSKLIDAGITRAKQSLSVQDAEINNLNRSIQTLRSNDVRRSVGRKFNAPPATADPQIEGLERRLTEATAKRETIAAALAVQEIGRNAAIEKAINESPNSVRKRIGLSAQLEALAALTSENPKLLLLILAFDFLSLALELGPMWAASSRIPSALAARLVLEHFIEVTRLAKDGAQKLGASEAQVHDANETGHEQPTEVAPAPVASPKAANDNAIVVPGLNVATPPRRGPGRPRKNGLDQNSREAGHEG
jgi:hypothetical protein